MSWSRHSRTVGLVFCLILGCAAGEKTVAVQGTVVKGGKPYTFTTQGLPPGDEGFRLQFIAQTAQGAGERFSAVFRPEDGTFRVSKANSGGLPPGTYRISLHRGAFGSADEFKGAFSPEKSPLKVEIPATVSQIEITIDLDSKKTTVK
jgi:hypothetical protein